MTMFQWVMIGLAGILVAPIFWEKAKGFIPQSKQPEPVPEPPEQDTEDACNGLVDVVECWDHLLECCESQDMHDASRELRKIFPLFVISTPKEDEA